jgi:hypothetical protein
MKYPEKANMPLDSKGNLPSDEAWEKAQRILARALLRKQQNAPKDVKGA